MHTEDSGQGETAASKCIIGRCARYSENVAREIQRMGPACLSNHGAKIARHVENPIKCAENEAVKKVILASTSEPIRI